MSSVDVNKKEEEEDGKRGVQKPATRWKVSGGEEEVVETNM